MNERKKKPPNCLSSSTRISIHTTFIHYWFIHNNPNHLLNFVCWGWLINGGAQWKSRSIPPIGAQSRSMAARPGSRSFSCQVLAFKFRHSVTHWLVSSAIRTRWTHFTLSHFHLSSNLAMVADSSLGDDWRHFGCVNWGSSWNRSEGLMHGRVWSRASLIPKFGV